MTKNVVSRVNIEFHGKFLTIEDMASLEELIRKSKQADHLLIDNARIRFYMHGGPEVDYSILDTVKVLLKKLGYLRFEIKAEEFAKVRDGYHYLLK